MTSARTAACLGFGFPLAVLLCLYNGAILRVPLYFRIPDSGHRLYASRIITPSTKNLFFIETSCAFLSDNDPGGLRLNSRMACAAYSTALYNPSRPVYIIHTCPLSEDYYWSSSAYVRKLLELPNISVVEVDVADLLTGSPLEPLLKKRLNVSPYRIEHTSDVLRLLLLWRYGGTYMDLDVVSLRSLDDLGTNFVGAPSFANVANGIMNFEPTGAGHEFVEKVISVLTKKYMPGQWATNGPFLVTGQLRKFCKVAQKASWQNVARNGSMNCGIRVYPSNIFYPISFPSWSLYYKKGEWKSVNKTLEQSYVAHVWNKVSKNTVIRVGSEQPYGQLAKYHCPPVYFNCGLYF